MKKITAFFTVCLSLFLVACKVSEEPPHIIEKDPRHTDVVSPEYGNTVSDTIALGMPAFLKGAIYEANNNIVKKTDFVSGYNDVTHNPNWVCWHYGTVMSTRHFDTELLLPVDMRTNHRDYEECTPEYNRGHLCPNGDHGSSTYTMINIVPQDAKVNGGAYAAYEAEMRRIADDGNKEYFSVAGPSIESDSEFIGKSSGLKIQIPSFVWRATIIIDNKQGNDLERINNSDGSDIEVYAIWIPNDYKDVPSRDWEPYIVSIDFIEEKTGLDLFWYLDEAIEDGLEARNSNSSAENL